MFINKLNKLNFLVFGKKSFFSNLANCQIRSAYRSVALLVMAFLILGVSALGLSWLNNKLTWEGQLHDAWWSQGVHFYPTGSDKYFSQSPEHIFSNYLVNTMAYKIKNSWQDFKNNFFIAPGLDSE